MPLPLRLDHFRLIVIDVLISRNYFFDLHISLASFSPLFFIGDNFLASFAVLQDAGGGGEGGGGGESGRTSSRIGG